ncbi:MAG: FAD binding domain-containing protein [Anaerolineales bacterium]|nr:FAD binding domain-containing protein [Anaerolineales bacterium]
MITEYHRPQSLEEALRLLVREETYPLGGGTVLNQPTERSYAVIDLQNLGLDRIHKAGNVLQIGSTARLQSLLESEHTPMALKTALDLEAPLNLRNMGTVAGALVACDGRSPFATAMLALDARVTVVGGQETADVPQSTVLGLGDILPLRDEQLQRRLITRIDIPLNVKLAFEMVARTPADRPIICAALAQWTAGRTRLVLGGWGASPSLAMDGSSGTGAEAAARNAAHEATDEWASAEYRREVAAILAKRCLKGIA